MYMPRAIPQAVLQARAPRYNTDNTNSIICSVFIFYFFIFYVYYFL